MLFAPLFWSLSFHFGLFSIGCVINSDSYRTSIYSKCRIGDCCFYFNVGSSFLASTLTLILAMPPRAHGREFRGVRVSNGVSLNPPCAVVETLVVDDESTLRNAATSLRRHGASSFLASTLTLILAMPPRAHGREFRGVRVSNGVSVHPPCAVAETLVVDDETTLRNAATSSRRHGASSSDSLLAKSNGSGDNAHRLSITLDKWYMQREW